MKLRWYVHELYRGESRPDWSKTMTFGKPWKKFVRGKPRLQYQNSAGVWEDVPTEVELIDDSKRPVILEEDE